MFLLFMLHFKKKNFFFFQVKSYEKLECPEERRKLAREIYDNFIMKELLAHSHVIFLFLSTHISI